MVRLLILVALVLVVVFWVKYRAVPSLKSSVTGQNGEVADGSQPKDGARQALLSQPLDPALLMTVLTLLAGGSKLRAINALRGSGLGLAAARALVNAIENGHRPPVTGQAIRVEEARLPDLASRAQALREDGFEQDAVQLVCAETGMDAANATRFVRALR